eukprot:m51a1_g9427 putative akirin 1 (147) ;mRNA; r:395291-396150
MLKTKRTFDAMMTDAEPEPQGVQFRPLSPEQLAPPAKRTRAPLTPLAAARTPRESFFAETRVDPPSSDELAQLAPRKKVAEGERTFTLSEVRQIVARAVADHERKLRAEYDRVLQQRLTEQFQSFSRFNQDHVARQMRDTECSYLS